MPQMGGMENVSETYLPAAGHDWVLAFYDPLMRLIGGKAAHRKLLPQAAIQPGHRILDIRCGTGTLAVLTQRLYPDAARPYPEPRLLPGMDGARRFCLLRKSRQRRPALRTLRIAYYSASVGPTGREMKRASLKSGVGWTLQIWNPQAIRKIVLQSQKPLLQQMPTRQCGDRR